MPPDPTPTRHFLYALAAAHRRDFAGAAALCRAASAADPGDVRPLRLAARLLRATGRAADAPAPLEQALRSAPADARLHRDMGLAMGQLGRHAEAKAALARATGLQPDDARAWGDLAAAALSAGDAETALAASDAALAIHLLQPIVLANRGLALRRLGRPEEARLAYALAVAIDPAATGPRLGLGHLLRRTGRPGEALDTFRDALALQPDNPDLHRWAGLVQRDLGRIETAIESLQSAVRLRPAFVEGWHDLGLALAAGGRHEQAVAPYRHVLGLAPRHAAALANLGSSLQELDRWPEAEDAFRRSLALAAEAPDVLYNLGNTLLIADRHAEAVDAFDQALRLAPDRVERRYNRGHALLGCGRLAEGWADLDDFWARARSGPPPSAPAWDGSPTAGRVLLWGEHGVGDEVLACGLLAEAASRAGAVVVATDARLVPVLQRSFPAIAVVARGSVIDGPVAGQRPLSSLPGLLRRAPAGFRPHDGYLRPDPDRVAALRARYAGRGGRLVVGLSWRSTNKLFGARKSVALDRWAPLLELPGITFVAVQHGDIAAEAAAAGILHDREIDPMVDLDGFAAQVAAMDLVVTVSNSTAHFAGALARPCWLMLPSGSGLLWHWQLCRGDRSPWYPSLRVFRQERPGDWDEMVARIAGELAATADRSIRANQGE